MICDDIDALLSTLEVVTPEFETLEDCKEFLVMSVVVALGISEGS